MADLPNQNSVAEGTLSSLQKSSMQPFGEIKQPSFYGLPDASREWDRALEDITEKLEGRYAQPNWFDVAAGFAKPQLGGFMASLGSASEALAKNVEQKRAQEMPIAQIKLMMAQNTVQRQHREAAQDIYDYALAESKKSGEPISDTDYGNIVAHVGENDPLAQAAKVRSATYLANQSGAINRTRANIEFAEKGMENPFLKYVNDNANNVGMVVPLSKEEAESAEKKLDKSLEKVATPEQIANMSIFSKQRLQNAVAQQNAEKTMSMQEIEAERAKNSTSRQSDLNEIRYLGVQPGMGKLFSIFKNGDGPQLLKDLAIAKGGNYAAAMSAVESFVQSNLANESPKLRAQADQMLKLVNKVSLDSRNALTNPTNLVQELSNMSNPDVKSNSHQGFLGIIDQMGYEDQYNIDWSNLRNGISGINPNTILNTPEAKKLNLEYRQKRAEHASRDPLKNAPDWYVGPAESQAAPENTTEGAAQNAPARSNPSRGTSSGTSRTDFLNGLRGPRP